MNTMTPVKNRHTTVAQKAVSTLRKLQGKKRPQTSVHSEWSEESSDSEGVLALIQTYNVQDYHYCVA